jgi:hypothetical protein
MVRRHLSGEGGQDTGVGRGEGGREKDRGPPSSKDG